MGMIPLQCTGCGKKLTAKEHLAGKKIRCPGCGCLVVVPELATSRSPATGLNRSVPDPPAEKLETSDLPTQLPPASTDATIDIPSAAADDDDAASLTDFLAPPQQPDEMGRLGPYRILKVLGRGGMGVVYKAEDPGLERLVALKAMLPSLAASGSAKKRFLREARAAAAIKHDHIVTIFQVGEDRGVPFLAMEFLEGEPLDERLKREGPLPLADTLRIGRETALGLAAAHKRGLVHRDIKPGNLWLETAAGEAHGSAFRVKILDFGLARAANDQTNLTQSGAIIGTPAYMAPEQAQGQPVDHRCDLFSLGVVLYRLCSGEMPFRGKDMMSILSSLALDQPRTPASINADVPRPLSDLVMRMLAKDPSGRIDSAAAVADALREMESSAPATKAPAESLPPKQTRPVRRTFVMAASAMVAVVLAVALPLLFWDRNEPGPVDVKPEVKPEPKPIAKVQPPQPPEPGWVQLFNGKDLTGWKYHPKHPGNWTVTDGVLSGGGLGNYLYTERGDYRDFHLRAEVLFPRGYSGIYFRTPFGSTWSDPSGQPGLNGANVVVNDLTQPIPTGTLRLGGILSDPVPKGLAPPDQWYTVEVIAQGNRLQSFIDGKPAATMFDLGGITSRGHIALQHMRPDIAIKFRNIEIKELTSPNHRNSLGMEFALVPRGKAWLGGGQGNPGPKEVEFKDDFYLGVYEVTQMEWTKVMANNPSFHSPTGKGKAGLTGVKAADLMRFPVESISWEECQEFVAQFNKKANEPGWLYRLPTEAEWEYACRGGPMKDTSESVYDYYLLKPATVLLPEQANFKFDALTRRMPKVGTYPPNRLGLHDMHGNVWEWCDDAQPPDPKDPAKTPQRVFRGGSFSTAAEACRAAYRSVDPATFRLNNLGLRLARVRDAAAPAPAVAPFDAKKAKEHQDAWAGHLGLKAEITNSIGMKLRLIPPGEFMMGRTLKEAEALISKIPAEEQQWMKIAIQAEAPQREVRIGAPFYLAAHEVTVGQFRRFVKATGYQTTAEREGEKNPGLLWTGVYPAPVDENLPVACVTAEDAQAFCAWASREEGLKYVLPTEEQWEYACRSGTTTLWWFGDDEALAPTHENFSRALNAMPVGSKRASPFGLFDMHGNVREWTTDARGEPRKRGGFIRNPAWWGHSAGRFPTANAKAANVGVGFRVAIVGNLKTRDR